MTALAEGMQNFPLSQFRIANGSMSTPQFAVSSNKFPPRGATPAVSASRKNYLFAGSDAGGERAAAIYSLIGTAKLNGLDPQKYLRNVLGRIEDHPINHIKELLPWNAARSIQPQMRQAA
jgi:transposase IS66-like protein